MQGTQSFILIIAFVLDLVFKDPKWLYHPVQAFGLSCLWLEKFLRKVFKSKLKLAGVLFLFLLIAFWSIIFFAIENIFLLFGEVFVLIFFIYITYSMLALGSLSREVSLVAKSLEVKDLERARQVAQGMVSRDLSSSSEHEIVRATVETATENISDGIVAPLFFFLLGGPLLMFLYKLVNTLDSMVGYKNEKYKDFGWATARFDDVLNLIPARITGFLIIFVAFISGDDYRGAFSSWWRDGQKGPSPNGGIPITAFAGARNISLGGPCKVGDRVVEIPFVGGNKKDFGKEEIGAALRYVYLVSIFTTLSILLGLVISK